jgi:hypothetical protein
MARRCVVRHRRDDKFVERGYRLRPVVGVDPSPTFQSAIWQAGRLKIIRSYDGQYFGGDGTVPRVSASPQEADSDQDAMFSGDKHGSLQNADGVHIQMRGWATEINLGSTPPTYTKQSSRCPCSYAIRPSEPAGGITDLGWPTN